jgi:6-pyruvoyltetrahydropterin/6-carboxytetrahydropterin synthase
MPIQLIRVVSFCAAHRVPAGAREPSRRLHGHLYRVELRLEGELDAGRGWLIDFGQVKQAFAPLAERLDHAYLNEVEGLEAGDRETLARWIFQRLKPELPALAGVGVAIEGELRFNLRRVGGDLPGEPLTESTSSTASTESTGSASSAPAASPTSPAPSRARVAFGVEAAHRLPLCGADHRCRNLHGHSLRIEVGADRLERLEGPLRAIYDRLDHRLLNELEGLENPTSENLAAWIWNALAPDVPDLRVVIVRESPHCACVYSGE